MSKIYLDVLLELIARFPRGASLEELIVGWQKPVSRRTMQRWVSQLIEEGKILAIGRARSKRYKISESKGEQYLKILQPQIFLTPESELLQARVTLPIHARASVGYCREFLENYRPNIDFYLPLSMRKTLSALGGSQEGKYPAGTYARQIFHRLLIDLSWNSSRLEGNTYSLLETHHLLEKGQAAEGKSLHDTQMILNHKAAIEFLINLGSEIGLSRYVILNIHTLLSDNLLPDPSSGGRLRSIPVGIGKSVYVPLAIPQVIEECFSLLLDKAVHIEDPFEQAFFLMVQLPYLQPFDDVNKRTSRLAANIPLIQKNLCPLSFVGVSEEIYINGLLGIYEQNQISLLRDLFLWAYEKSCALYSTIRQVAGEPDPFRFQYRRELYQLVANLVRSQKNPLETSRFIRTWAEENIVFKDQARFIELVEKEILSLHEGNLARYGLRLSEYSEWKKLFFTP